jgi:hypothetical protein
MIDRAMGNGMATDRLVYLFLFLRRIGWFTGRAARFPVDSAALVGLVGGCASLFLRAKARVASIAYPFASPRRGLHLLDGWTPRGVGVSIYRSAAGMVRLFNLRQRTCPLSRILARTLRASLNWTRDVITTG